MRLIWTALLLTCTTLSVAAGGEPDSACPVSIQYEFYSVHGSSEQEIKASMLASGPKDEKGTARFAYTAWTVRWQWPKGPDVAQTRIECSARITLPKHATPENLSPALLAQWQGLVTRITAHEHRHVSHVEEGAPKILERLRRSAAHKTLTSKEANAIAHNVLLEIQEADRRYDRDTEHGKSEGTWGF